ncbi:MAG: hypothetical protein N4A33_00420 [Bacteriovoracaceae bacterium]|jgi:ABC-type Zn2+ transport system substrate-binding protein/surface adhesin|nr:hypothetical protein [Bacteriovoracaceae bacterium]
MKHLLSISLLLISFCLLVKAYSQVRINDINIHLASFSKFNATEHDNIDDEYHSHTHKHSEHGQEHEHGHEHKSFSQIDFKIMNTNWTLIEPKYLETQDNFYKNFLHPVAYPNNIFRPPMV